MYHGVPDPSEDFDGYGFKLSAICSDSRVLVERAVEDCLLNNVVRRFRRSVMTKDRLFKLSLINLDDAKYLDALMTKYSAYKHSQPMELPAKLPNLADVVADIEALRDWTKEFSSRTSVNQ